MITVQISINGGCIYARSAVKIKDEDANGKAAYRVDDGQIIEHNYSDGAIVLAKKLLDTIHESKGEKQ
jgi:hypothetical protein